MPLLHITKPERAVVLESNHRERAGYKEHTQWRELDHGLKSLTLSHIQTYENVHATACSLVLAKATVKDCRYTCPPPPHINYLPIPSSEAGRA